MTRSALLWAVGLGLIAVACTGDGGVSPLRDEFTTFPPETAATTTAAPLPAATTAPPTTVAAIPPPTNRPVEPEVDRLVVLDASGNIAVVDADGSNHLVITDAANEGAAFFQPLWAPGSQLLAWGEASPAGFAVGTAAPDGADRGAAAMPSPPFFFHWSPDGRHIAAMHNGINGVELKLVDAATAEATFVGSGVPFYISWNPEAGDLVAHIGADRLAIIDAVGSTEELGRTDEGYQAPQWVAEGIIHLIESEVRLLDASGVERSLATVSGSASFVANDQGTRLAVQSFSPDAPGLTVALQRVPHIPSNVVAVVDLESGATTVAFSRRALAFFWSPDGEKLLILDADDEPGRVNALVWSDGETVEAASFSPPRSFVRDVLPFFAQYAQSYQPWAPDSTAFAFAGSVDDEEGVWVQHLDGTPAERITDGTWVSWSDR